MIGNLILDKKRIVYIGVVLYMIRTIVVLMNLGVSSLVLEALLWGIICCCIMGIIMSAENEAAHIIGIIVLIVMYINYKRTLSWTLLCTFLIVYAIKDIDIRDIVNLMFKIAAPFLVLDSIWYFINLALGTVSLVQSREVGGAVVYRHGFFFSQANTFSYMVLFTSFMFVYLYHDTINKKKMYLILILVAIFIYIFPNSRTTSLILVLYILFDIKKPEFIQNGIYIFCKYSYLISCILVTIVVALFIINPLNPIPKAVDTFLNGRISMVVASLILYGVKPLGSRIINEGIYLPIVGHLLLYLDNFYGMILIRFGAICAIIISYVSLKTSFTLYKTKKYTELVLFAMVFIFGLSEGTAMSVFPVFQWLFIRDALFLKKISK